MAETASSMTKGSRNLLYLAGATFIAVVLAVVAVSGSRKDEKPAFTPERFFPGLSDRFQEVSEITLVSQDETVSLERTDQGTWVVPEMMDLPADPAQLRSLFEGLRTMEKISPKTAKETWHRHLDLLEPNDQTSPDDEGMGILARLKGSDGAEIAAILVGKEDEAGAIGGRSRFHARLPDADQTWLVSGMFPRDIAPRSWVDTKITTVTREDIRSVEITPEGEAPYSVSRTSVLEDDFTVAPVPEGRELRSAFVANGVATAIAGLEIDDVQAADTVAGETPIATAVYETFHGLVLTLTQYKTLEESWLKIAASAKPPVKAPAPETAPADDPAALETDGTEPVPADGETVSVQDPAADETGGSADPVAQSPAVEREERIDPKIGAMVNRINGLTNGRIFKVPGYKADQMAKPLEDLLRPQETPAAESVEGDPASAGGDGQSPVPGDVSQE